MPRPKVRPEDRQRSLKACLPCQASKIRCDSQTPCTSCTRRDRPGACVYNSESRRRHYRNREVRFAPVSRPSLAGRPASTPPTSRPAREIRSPTENGDEIVDSPSEAASTIAAPTQVQSPECTESRLLLSSKGEKGDRFSVL